MLEKQFFYKGQNYKRSGMNLEQSIKACKVAFRKAVKLGENRETLENEFKKGFESK